MNNVTLILTAIEQGDARAADKLLPLVYKELRRLADHKMSKEPQGQTLQATALVHEAYIRLVGSEAQNWNSRGHFFGAAAEAMRRILIENARRKQRLKRRSGREKVELRHEDAVIETPSDDLIALDEALTELAEIDRTKVELVKLRYFAGLTLEQAGDFLEIPAIDPDITLDESPLTEGPETVIGRYKLLEKIGEGGMASVYMAEQKQPIRRRVALKIIKLGMDTKQVIARFEAERQALAMMDHPNIAKVLDAGTTDTGRPYFVMELVRGIAITEFSAVERKDGLHPVFPDDWHAGVYESRAG